MSSGIQRNSSTRTVRKVEVPRPLKESSLHESSQKFSHSTMDWSSYVIDCVEKLIALMDMVVVNINQYCDSNVNSDSPLLTNNIINLCKYLKIYGPQLENSIYQGQLDRAFLTFREGMVHGMLEYEAREHLLDIVELRECNWIPRKNFCSISSNDFGDYVDVSSSYQQSSISDSSASFNSDEFIKRTAKNREKGAKSGSKLSCRNEVIIRNSDSGKVMGVRGRRVHMIEQLSETIISFQRVPPTAKERVVQITGSSEDKISYASRLIENTIRNNISPVKELCRSESSCSSEDSSCAFEDYENFLMKNQKYKMNDQPYLYKHKVIVKNCQLIITGDDYTYVTNFKNYCIESFVNFRALIAENDVRNLEETSDYQLERFVALAFISCLQTSVAKAILDDYFSKLRTSESPEYDCNGEDLFLENKGCYNEDLIKPESLYSRSGLGTFESSNSDFSNVSNVSTSLENSFSYLNSDFRNFSVNHPSDTQSMHYSPYEFEVPSKQILDDDVIDSPFTTEPYQSSASSSFRTSYTKEFLMLCRKSVLSQQKPVDWETIIQKFPQLVKEDAGFCGNNITEK